MMVLEEVTMERAPALVDLRLGDLRRALTEVHDGRAREVVPLVPEAAKPLGHVGLLRVHEQSFVEEADLLERVASYGHGGAGCHPDAPRAGAARLYATDPPRRER